MWFPEFREGGGGGLQRVFDLASPVGGPESSGPVG